MRIKDTTREHKPKTNILVVDPDLKTLREIREGLHEAGCVTCGASNKDEAFAALLSFRADIVLLERALSDEDGINICRQLISSGTHGMVRVILMSGLKTTSDDIADALEAGAEAYLVKPFSRRELIARVRVLTECQDREQALQQSESEQRLRSVFNAVTGVAIQAYDKNRRVVFWNPASELLYGYSSEEAMGKRLEELIIPEEGRSAFIEEVRRWYEEGVSIQPAEIEALHKNGNKLLVYSNQIMITNRRGENEMFCFDIDLTERKKAEELVKVERHRLASIIEGTNVATWEWDVQTGWCNVNEKWANIIGYSLQEISPVTIETWVQYCHPDDLKSSSELFERHFSGELAYYDCEVRMLHKNGSWIWIHDRGKLISRTEEGKPCMVMGTHTEITQRKHAEEALARSEERFRRIMSNAVDMIFRVSLKDGSYEYVNDAALEITGYASEEWIQTPFLIRELLHPDWRDWLESAYEEVCAGRIEPTYEYQIIHAKSGVTRWINQRNVLIYNDAGEPIALEGIMTDVTEAKNIEGQLRSANNAKDEFLAVMSHDLRSPLNPILGFAELLLENASGDEVAMLNCIKDSGQRMLKLVDSLLEFARLDRASVTPSIHCFNLLEACVAVFNEVSAESKGIAGNIVNGNEHLSPLDESLEVISDRSILTRIFVNLLQNAFKYTEEGSVTFTLGQTQFENEPRPTFCFIVEDTGIGIDQALLSTLFEPFTQADSSYERKNTGVGLGLAICNKLAELLNGTIEVSSELGEGSRFTLKLPLEVSKSIESNRQKGMGSRSKRMTLERALRVLIVDDEPANFNLVEAMIHRIGGIPFIANGGREAIDRCQKESFDVILMDLRMPDVNGFQATERIRQNGQLNAETPIVAATANVSSENEEKCLKLGMSAFVRKPMRMEELFNELAKIAKV